MSPQARRVLSLLQEMHRLGTTVVVATHSEGLVGRTPRPGAAAGRGPAGRAWLSPDLRRSRGRDPLGLRRALSDRLLPALVAAMALLAALALAGARGAAELTARWEGGAATAMTVQLPPPPRPAAGWTAPWRRWRRCRRSPRRG